MANSNSSLDFTLPAKRTTATAEFGFVDSSDAAKKHCSAAASTAASSTVNMAGGSSLNGGANAAGNGKAPIGGGSPPEIDEDLHSRQLAVYGRETMRRLFASSILISGMQGLGAEIGNAFIIISARQYVFCGAYQLYATIFSLYHSVTNHRICFNT